MHRHKDVKRIRKVSEIVCGHLEWTQGVGGLQSEAAQKYDRSEVRAVETVETID